MVSYQELAATGLKNLSLNSTTVESALATMQTDMDVALKNKKQTSSVQSNDMIAQLVNKAGDSALDEAQVSRVIEMAWEDRTPFGAIEHSYGLSESDVIKLMRQELKPSSFRLWRQRVSNRATKHQAKRDFEVGRAYCKTQYKPR